MSNYPGMLPEFQKMPSLNLSYKPWVVGPLNCLLSMLNLLQRKKSDVVVRKMRIPREDGSQLPVQVLTPPNASGPLPCLVYYHGGAFALTYGSTHITMCEDYAREAGCCVIFVDYRLMPRHPFPAGLDDCYLALEWATANAATLDIDPQRIAVGGDSAGGALSASVSQMAQDRGTVNVCGQMLIYPVIDKDCKTESARNFSDTPIWTSLSNSRMWECYLKNVGNDPAPPYASPITRESLAGLPPAYVETAEFDPLHDEGIDYAKKMIEGGVEVIVNETRGTVHGYDALAQTEVVHDAMSQRFRFLQSVFSPAQA